MESPVVQEAHAMTETCEKCGAKYSIGDSPWCRDRHAPTKLAVHPDDVPGGFWVENGFDRPTWFPSHSAHEAALAKQGYEIRAKWAGPHDKHLTNWAAGMDAKTLDNARVLLERGIAESRSERARLEALQQEVPIAVRTMAPEEVGQ
jgi:hypothetical protein